MTAIILSPGPQTTLQGRRRQGYRHRGVPWSGAADSVSYAIGNRLLGNSADAMSLEVTFGGFSAQFERSAHIAVTGADCPITIDGADVPNHKTLFVSTGQTISLGGCERGLRAYLAIAGGWSAASVLGSASTYLPARLGGLEGRALARNEVLDWTEPDWRIPDASTPDELRPNMLNSWALRCVPSAEYLWLDAESQERLFADTFIVDRASNRMGLRLSGTPLCIQENRQLPSTAVFPGGVQCPSSGAPIVLVADGQTTGGYPRVCQIIRADRHLLGQVRPNDRLRFLRRSFTDARTTYSAKLDLLRNWMPEVELY